MGPITHLPDDLYVQYKSKTTFDAGYYYAPYIPLNEIVMGSYQHWTTFMVPDSVCDYETLHQWLTDTCGKQHSNPCILLLDKMFGIFSRWQIEYLGPRQIGYSKIYLHKPEDIAMFKMVWC